MITVTVYRAITVFETSVHVTILRVHSAAVYVNKKTDSVNYNFLCSVSNYFDCFSGYSFNTKYGTVQELSG